MIKKLIVFISSQSGKLTNQQYRFNINIEVFSQKFCDIWFCILSPNINEVLERKFQVIRYIFYIYISGTILRPLHPAQPKPSLWYEGLQIC